MRQRQYPADSEKGGWNNGGFVSIKLGTESAMSKEKKNGKKKTVKILWSITDKPEDNPSQDLGGKEATVNLKMRLRINLWSD